MPIFPKQPKLDTQSPHPSGLTSHHMAFMALLIGAIAIGGAPIFMRLSDVSTSAAAFWRCLIAVPPFFIIWFWRRHRGLEPPLDRRMLGLIILVSFSFAVDLFFWHWSVALTSVANATLLSNLAALITALFSFFILRQWLGLSFWLGLGLALLGALLLVGVNAELNPDYLFGDLMACLTAFAYAAYILMTAKARQKVSLIGLMAFSSLFSAVFLLVPALLESAPFWPETRAGWLPLLGLGVIGHIMGQGLIAYSLMLIPATLGSLTLLIQPVIAACLAWLLFSEALGGMQIFGGFAVLSGVALAKLSQRKK